MFDIAVIGLGPGGLEVVKQALKNNLSVIAFNNGKLGGTCLNVGCIPTKTILHSAVSFNDSKSFNDIGISNSDALSYNWQKIKERADLVVEKFVKSLELLVKNLNNFKFVDASAEIVIKNDSALINAGGLVYEAKNIIIATGSKPRDLKGLEFDHKFILSSDDLFALENLPNSIVIVGSGAIGVEWAYIMSSFGVNVTLVEKAKTILPSMDKDIQKTVERVLTKNGVKIFKDCSIDSYTKNHIVLSNKNELDADIILSCVGRVPVLPGIKSDSGSDIALTIKDNGDTDLKNIFVIGDATGHGMLAHNAQYQAKKVINSLVGKNMRFCPLPAVVYTSPEAASAGVNEQDIDETYVVKKVNLTSLQKAWCDNSTTGFVKLILKDNIVKGAHIVSNEASSLISLLSFIISYQIPADEVKDMIYPHPGYSEIISEVLNR